MCTLVRLIWQPDAYNAAESAVQLQGLMPHTWQHWLTPTGSCTDVLQARGLDNAMEFDTYADLRI